MNPSAPGWIKKHLAYFLASNPHLHSGEDAYYDQLRDAGFIYGASVKTLADEQRAQLEWTEEEKTKVNLLDALVFTYYDTIANPKLADCVQAINGFYAKLSKRSNSFLKFPRRQLKPEEKLERILNARIQTNESLLQKNFSNLITNALLFVDVLAFDHQLLTGESPLPYATRLESTLTSVIWLALQQKQEKDDYDELLIRLFEGSLRYSKALNTQSQELASLDLQSYALLQERRYIFDLACLAVHNDGELDRMESKFLKQLAKELYLKPEMAQSSNQAVNHFIKAHIDDISYLNYSNPLNHFYGQMSRTTRVLIMRNKKRLLVELSESKDLVLLLGQSTIRELNAQEKRLVRNQLLDICKSIPSLAIFILPGGGILLPLLVKLIPQLLPSAFNENRSDEDVKTF
ncbi:LETM1-related biofilm-associated protein [Croceiramulus getboli]|nr:LETM1-related biofilm-associated protein [Flavobacteriaceae bacterium YJPT1-3]